MIRPRRVQAVPLYALKPSPTRLCQRRRATWPPLSDAIGYLLSVGTILWLGAAATRFAEGR